MQCVHKSITKLNLIYLFAFVWLHKRYADAKIHKFVLVKIKKRFGSICLTFTKNKSKYNRSNEGYVFVFTDISHFYTSGLMLAIAKSI